ncbi:MAG TPA: DUF1707 domain-containing protein [Actinocatenispora sp.]
MSEGGKPGEDPRSGVRIGDAERESALTALGEHLSAGRLDIDEYGDRSARVTAARTREELAALFDDLPAPHPTFQRPPAEVPAVAEETAVARRPPGGTVGQRAAAGFMGVSWIVGIGLAATTHIWWLIFLPIALSAVFGSVWGRGWQRDVDGRDRDRHRDRHRDYRRDR